MTKTALLSFVIIISSIAYGQNKPFVSHPDQLNDVQYANWISPEPGSGYGVLYFRKKIILESIPKSFIVHVSADNRYNLYVNGRLVSWGPAVDDLMNWNYETIDLTPYLLKGENIIASQVWNMGFLKGQRQISYTTAFILQGNGDTEHLINTNRSWVVEKDEGYHWMRMTREVVGGGYIAGGTDSLISKLHPWDWEKLSYDDSGWSFAREIGKGNHLGLDDWKGTQWLLKSREIPPMEQKKEIIPDLLLVKGIDYVLSEYKGKLNMVIPPNTKAELLLDNQVLTMGIPHLQMAGGTGSKIKLQYQESLFDKEGRKGNRNEWEGKEMKGYYDIYIAHGKERLFRPLWIRVFRYVKISVETKDEALILNDFYNIYTAYPFNQAGKFHSEKEILNEIWDVSWRTARLCALETYMDCPYYEQKQYIGDTRIQALISMYVAGDDLLVKNAIRQFYNSMQPMGLFTSSHPSEVIQIIPPFSLLYIGMVHDYHMLRDDAEFVKQFIPGIRFTLEWFVNRIADNGIMGPIPYWNHIDGGTNFRNGSPPGISDGGSAHMTILLAYAIDKAMDLFMYYGFDHDVERFRLISDSLKKNTLKLCYDQEKQLIAETLKKEVYSQHTNSFAILTSMFDSQTEKLVARNVIEDESLIQATLYFNFYVFQALKKAGMGGEVIDLMQKWKEFLDYGLTTFPEHGIESRSDCHAWSAHPMFDFLNITCGIEPSSPGFKTVLIQPQPGSLTEIHGTAYHPLGEISVSLIKDKNGKTDCKVMLPEGLKGELVFKGKSYTLPGIKNEFVFK